MIGSNAVIGDGVRLSNCVLMSNAAAKDVSVGDFQILLELTSFQNCFVNNSIIGWYSSVGKWARLNNTCVLGEDVHVSDEIYMNGGSVLPHKVF